MTSRDGNGQEASSGFVPVRRNEFRQFFQPSRIALAVLRAPTASEVNVITVCFLTHCSYRPRMMCFSIHGETYSSELVRAAREIVLAVPGERLAAETMYCGVRSGREVDKVSECGLTLTPSVQVSIPSIEKCVANVELRVAQIVPTGDCATIVGEVVEFTAKPSCTERNLLSVSDGLPGYEVLVTHGGHRIGVPLMR